MKMVLNVSCVAESQLINTVYFTVRMLESVLAVTLNSVTIVICVRHRKMWTNSNILIVSLAVGDLISGLDSPFYLAAELLKQSVTGNVWCVTAEIIDLIGGFGNTFSIAGIALDRFVSVAFPLLYRRRLPSKQQLISTLVLMWIYICLFLGVLFIFGQEGYKYGLCTFKSNLTSWAHDGVIFGHVAVFSSLTFFLYISTLQKLALRRSFTSSHCRIIRQRRQHRIARTLGILLVVYVCLAMPIVIASFSGVLDTDMSPWQHALFRICWAVWYLNSLVNPLLYAWSNRSFRKAICCRERH